MIYIHELAPPPGKKFAEGMRYTDNFVQPLVDSIVHLESLRILPDLTETYRYYIYSLTQDLQEKGHTVVLRTSHCSFFYLKICCNYDFDGCPRLYLKADIFDGNVDELVFRGRIWGAGIALVYNAFNLLDRLSFYFKYEKNAMRFAEKFLTTLGIGYYRFMADFERVLLMAYGYSAAEIFLELYSRAPVPRRTADYYIMSQIKTLERAFF